jgi:hypothetical protein
LKPLRDLNVNVLLIVGETQADRRNGFNWLSADDVWMLPKK